MPEYHYTIGIRDESQDIWDTLPLRTGVHPIYRNLGGLPLGGGFSFSVVSTGGFAVEGTALTIIPHLCMVTESGYREVAIYYEQETEKGVFLRKWSAEEETMVLYADRNSAVDDGTSSWVWKGSFRLPERLWVTETEVDVAEYQQQFGLSFEETFWITDAQLMLRFALCLENENGECLYYGMLPEEAEENTWVQEAGEPYREDYDKNRYEIFGGEIAVIYPGDSAGRWYDIHGIY